MEIQWHGSSFFEIEEKIDQEKVIVATDPVAGDIGCKTKKIRADILLISSSINSNFKKDIVVSSTNKEPFIIKEPGEYEIKGIRIKGIPYFCNDTKESNVIFTIQAGDIKICYMDNFDGNGLSPKDFENISGIDILLMPVGIGKEAAKIVGQIAPKIVIPMQFRISGDESKILEGEKEFLSAMGVKEKERITKLKVKKTDLQREGTEVVLLKTV